MADVMLPDLDQITALYDANRYLDAYEVTKEFWERPELVPELEAEYLVMGGRLGGRLGNDKVQRWLFREALARSPELPLVRYFCDGFTRRRQDLYSYLKDADKQKTLETDDQGLLSSWYASQAVYWAMVSDYYRAHKLLELSEEAVETLSNDTTHERAWYGACKAQVLLDEDRWDEALASAEYAWELSPGMPAAGGALGRALTKCGRMQDAAERLGESALQHQSHEITRMATWYMCATAERVFPDGHQAWAERALPLVELGEKQAPLADRGTTISFNMARLDLALVLDDREEMTRLAETTPGGLFDKTLERLRKSGDSPRTVLPVAQVPQKHNTCLPASMAAVADGMGDPVDADELAKELTYGGTSKWAAADWLVERGYKVCHFVATADLVRELIGAGLPFIYGMEWEMAAHATAAFGLDEATGTLLLHDPSQDRWSRINLESLGNDEQPLGPKCLAFAKSEQVHLLELIPDDLRDPITALHEYSRRVETSGPKSGEELIEQLARSYPDHPITTYMKALHFTHVDQMGDALELFAKMVEEFPHCMQIRRTLVMHLHRVGNTGQIRQVLEEVINQKLLMGTRIGETWRYPPSNYLCQYADLISLSADRLPEGEELLLKALRRNPLDGEAYHVLGDLMLRDNRLEEALLPYRLGACLYPESDHYARAYTDLRRQLGQEEEGLAFLKRRGERFSKLKHGVVAWTTYLDALDDYGRPGEAREMLKSLREAHADDADILAYATRFWVPKGEWEAATEALEALKNSDRALLYLEVLSYYQAVKGEWEASLETCETWTTESPHSLQAWTAYLRNLARREGRQAALEKADELRQKHPGHDEFEMLYFDHLTYLEMDREVKQVLHDRLERNQDDAWAWRELAHRTLDEIDLQGIPLEDARRDEFNEAFRHAKRTSPDEAATRAITARLTEVDGNPHEAIEHYLELLENEPGYGIAYRRAWECATGLEKAEEEALQAKLEGYLMKVVGFKHGARNLAFLIADRHGLPRAMAAVERWLADSPRDPELLEAQADLLLEHGEGRTDGERAAVILEQAIRDFPGHADLRLSLARAYAVLLRRDQEVEVWRDYIRRYPTVSHARDRLARVLDEADGTSDEPVELLAEAVKLDPLDQGAILNLARIYWVREQVKDAIDVLRQALDHMPEAINLRENLIYRYFDLNMPEEAVAVARKGVEIFPDGAYLQLMLAQALNRSDQHTDLIDVEAAYKDALALNSSLFEAADDLAVIYARVRRYADAKALLEAQIPLQRDPCFAKGRLAWLRRIQDENKEALDDLAAVVKAAPWYVWGWSTVMEWIEEDECWEMAKELFASVPEVMMDSPDFRSRRLELLEAAGRRASTLVEEWDRLLEDFPQHHGLYMRRVDCLWGEERYLEATRVLEKAERFHARSTYVRARRVRILCHDKKKEEALAAAGAIWVMADDDEEWPEVHAWECLLRAGWVVDAWNLLLGQLHEYQRPRVPVFRAAMGTIGKVQENKQLDELSFGGWTPDSPGLLLNRLLEHLAEAPWDAALHRGVLLGHLDELGLERSVLDFYEANPELCQRETPVWQQVGYVLQKVDQAKSREFLSSWRDRQGVEMFAVCNYIMSLRPGRSDSSLREQPSEIFASAGDALERLPFDHTARYLACSYAEIALRFQGPEQFMEAIDRAAPLVYMDDPERRYYLPNHAWFLPEVLSVFHRYYGQEEDIDALTDELSPFIYGKGQPKWVGELWLETLGDQISGVKRLALKTTWFFKRLFD